MSKYRPAHGTRTNYRSLNNYVAASIAGGVNGRAAEQSEETPCKIIHMGTGNLVSRFRSRAEAEQWLRQYGVSQEYKDRFYKIVED